MRRQDVWVLVGVVLLVGFGLYAAVVGSDYSTRKTPAQRLLESVALPAAETPARPKRPPAAESAAPPSGQKSGFEVVDREEPEAEPAPAPVKPREPARPEAPPEPARPAMPERPPEEPADVF